MGGAKEHDLHRFSEPRVSERGRGLLCAITGGKEKKGVTVLVSVFGWYMIFEKTFILYYRTC